MTLDRLASDTSSAPAPKLKWTHVDDWLDAPSWGDVGERYAKFVLNYARMPAWAKSAYYPWMRQFKLFCTHGGKRYRCIGASRLGDVWLTEYFERENGYDIRVYVNECSEWSDTASAIEAQPTKTQPEGTAE